MKCWKLEEKYIKVKYQSTTDNLVERWMFFYSCIFLLFHSIFSLLFYIFFLIQIRLWLFHLRMPHFHSIYHYILFLASIDIFRRLVICPVFFFTFQCSTVLTMVSFLSSVQSSPVSNRECCMRYIICLVICVIIFISHISIDLFIFSWFSVIFIGV